MRKKVKEQKREMQELVNFGTGSEEEEEEAANVKFMTDCYLHKINKIT